MLLRILPAVASDNACGEVKEAWAPFMATVVETIATKKWKELEMPAKLTREMFGK